MKKLMFAVAAVAAGVALADVTSANVVGYVTKPALSMNYSMIGCNLTDVGGAQGVKISDIICKDGFKMGSSTTDSDWIEIWRTTGSSYYYIWEDDEQWYEVGADDPVTDADVINPGEAAWYFHRKTEPTTLDFEGLDL